MTEMSNSKPNITVDCLETFRKSKETCQALPTQQDSACQENIEEITTGQKQPQMVDPRFIVVEPFYSIH